MAGWAMPLAVGAGCWRRWLLRGDQGENFFTVVESLGLSPWMPQILRGYGFGVTQIGFIAAGPCLRGGISMLVCAPLADRATNRAMFLVGALVVALVVASAGLPACALLPASTILEIASLWVAVPGLMAFQGTTWPLPMRVLSRYRPDGCRRFRGRGGRRARAMLISHWPLRPAGRLSASRRLRPHSMQAAC